MKGLKRKATFKDVLNFNAQKDSDDDEMDEDELDIETVKSIK